MPQDGVIRVEDLLRSPALQLRLIAGESGTSRRVAWAHVSELEDPTPWLFGAEMIMTTGIALPASARRQRAYLERLDDAGVACLALSEQLSVPPLTEAFLAAADERGFPVVEVPLAGAVHGDLAGGRRGRAGRHRPAAQRAAAGLRRGPVAGRGEPEHRGDLRPARAAVRLPALRLQHPAGPAAGRGPGPAARAGEAHTGHAGQPADGAGRVRAAGVRAAGHRGLHPGHGDGPMPRRPGCRWSSTSPPSPRSSCPCRRTSGRCCAGKARRRWRRCSAACWTRPW